MLWLIRVQTLPAVPSLLPTLRSPPRSTGPPGGEEELLTEEAFVVLVALPPGAPVRPAVGLPPLRHAHTLHPAAVWGPESRETVRQSDTVRHSQGVQSDSQRVQSDTARETVRQSDSQRVQSDTVREQRTYSSTAQPPHTTSHLQKTFR